MSAQGDAAHLSIAADVEKGCVTTDAQCTPSSPCDVGLVSSDVTEECPSPAGLSDDEEVTCATDELLGVPVAPSRWMVALRRAFADNWQLLVWCPVCIVSNVGQTVTLDVAGKTLRTFPYWLFWSTAVAFLVVFAIGFAIAVCMHKGPGPYVDAASRKVPLRFFVAVGFLTAMNGVFLLFSGPHVPGVMQALLGPTVVTIPMCMGFSFLLLRARYSLAQVGAVMVIIGGVLLAAADQLTGSSSHDKAYWSFLWFLGSIPAALNSVYEEHTLKSVPTMPLPFVMAVATIFQVLTIFAVATPLSVVPGFGPIKGGFKQLYPTQKAATKCFLNMYPIDNATGYSAVVEDGQNLCPLNGDGEGCRCDISGAWVAAFTVAYIFANYSNLAVVKHGGATLMFVISTLVTPISAFCFSAEWVVGPDFQESLSAYNYGAIAVLLIGVTAYRCASSSAEKRVQTVTVA